MAMRARLVGKWYARLRISMHDGSADQRHSITEIAFVLTLGLWDPNARAECRFRAADIPVDQPTCSMLFVLVGQRIGAGKLSSKAVEAERSLDSCGIRGPDSLVDLQCLAEVCALTRGVRIMKRIAPDSFQSTCLLE
jgi:hypothetical protein